MTASILCPVDFSAASRTALLYAAAIAEHFGSALVVMTANDPLLAEAAAMDAGHARVRDDTRRELERLFSETLERPLKGASVAFEVATGAPGPEILRVARARRAGLIVMSSHGLSGFRKLFFGSTTERVLRETPAPVLVVPGEARGPDSLEEAARSVRRVLSPVLPADTDGNARQIAVVQAIARALGVPAILLHVVEPVRAVLPKGDYFLPSIEQERRARAEAQLAALAGGHQGLEPLIAYGEPSEEIVKVARDRGAGLIVMSLQGSPLAGARIGSVTYRVLCAARTLVLALPGRPSAGRGKIRTARKITPAPAARDGRKTAKRSAKR
jgi:universal stress protein A